MTTGKKIKDKKVIQLGRVATPKKRFVTQDSPLSDLTLDHPDYDTVEVIDSSVNDLEDSSIDIESPSLSINESDSIYYFSGSEDIESTQLTLDVPSNISVDIFNINRYASPDGTQRISLNVNFDETLRATDYEVRIASV
jgi:hypothetical protein